MTPLPEPVTDVWASWRGEREFLSARDDYYTESQLKAYGAAEYKRAIEACAKHFSMNADALFWGSQAAEAIRKLGEKS